MRFIFQSDEVGNESQPRLALLKLAEQDVIGTDLLCHRLQISNVARLAKDRRVSDDGKGIIKGDRARVFQTFFTVNREGGGTGLGLPIARSLLAATGGTIELDPTKNGAAFRICLIVASRADAPK